MRLVVLSPHRDDATFSLALSLRHWSSAGVSITVVNFFTQSAYAPYAPDGANISALRADEDRRSLRAVDPQIYLRSLSFLDAPLRLPIDFGAITNPAVFTPVSEEVERMSNVIRSICRRALAIAPLGLGEHIDHRTVRDAAIVALPRKSVAFYEDLPYASWTSESDIRKRISTLEAQLMTPLSACRQRSRNWRFKNRAVRSYHSQIDDSMAVSISRYGEKYNGGERIWVPRHSARWRALLFGPLGPHS
jgi:LmbE family N-acetylglucosaminyl deacetylase